MSDHEKRIPFQKGYQFGIERELQLIQDGWHLFQPQAETVAQTLRRTGFDHIRFVENENSQPQNNGVDDVEEIIRTHGADGLVQLALRPDMFDATLSPTAKEEMQFLNVHGWEFDIGRAPGFAFAHHLSFPEFLQVYTTHLERTGMSLISDEYVYRTRSRIGSHTIEVDYDEGDENDPVGYLFVRARRHPGGIKLRALAPYEYSRK
jgi:hypothetical protein